MWIVTSTYVQIEREIDETKIPFNSQTSVYAYAERSDAINFAKEEFVTTIENGAIVQQANIYYGQFAFLQPSGNLVTIDVHGI